MEWGCHGFALGHSELVQQVEDVVPSRDHKSDRSPNYLDAEEVVELLHVRHLELVGKEGFDLIDFDEMLTSND